MAVALASLASSALASLAAALIAIWMCSRFVLPRIISFAVRVTNARGVTIHVGSVGFLHVSDVLVTFASGPIESVRVDDVLYTGKMLTLLTWLYEFVSKRLKGARLRDGLPVARTETSRTDAKDAPESQQSPSRDSEEKTKSRRAAILRQSSLAAATREGEPGRSPKGDYGASTDHEADAAESRADANDTNHRGDGAETRETKLPALRRAGSWLAFPKSGTSPRGSPRSPGTPPRGGFDPGTSDSPRSAHTTWAPGASLNVPVLVAGVLVTMRGRTETARDETRRDAGLAEKTPETPATEPEPEPPTEPSDTKPLFGEKRPDAAGRFSGFGFKTRFATWQLVKGFLNFLELTATDVAVANYAGSATGVGRVSFRRVALKARMKPTAMLVSLETDVVTCHDSGHSTREANERSADETLDDAEKNEETLDERASFRDGRLDVTLRYVLRDGRVAVAEAALDVASVEVTAGDRTGDRPRSDGASGDDGDGDGEPGASSPPTSRSSRAIASPTAALTRLARAVPARVTVRAGAVRVREANARVDASFTEGKRLALETDAFYFAAERRAREKRSKNARGGKADKAASRAEVSRVDARWSRLEIGVLGSDEATATTASAAARVAARGGAVRLDLPLVEDGDDEPRPRVARAPTTVPVNAEIAGLDARLHPDLVFSLRRALKARSSERSRLVGKEEEENEHEREKEKDIARFVFETECVFSGGVCVVAYEQIDSGSPRVLAASNASRARLGVNVLDDRVAESERDSSKPSDSESSSVSESFGSFAGRGVVLHADDWVWSTVSGETNETNETETRTERKNVLKNSVDCLRASRIEARRFGDARDVEIVDARADARVDALAELETRFVEAFAALSKCARDVSFGSSRERKKNKKAAETFRLSRLVFVRARVRVRVDAFPDARPNVVFPVGSNLSANGKEKENENAGKVPCALELVAPRLVFETRKSLGEARLENAACADSRIEKRVDAFGAFLTYVDAMDPQTPQCEGFADVETPLDAPRGVAGSSADGGTDERDGSSHREGEARVAVASFRSASVALVSVSRFSGDDSVAAAEVVPTESSVTCDGARCRWDPDAHFAILRVREAWAQLAERRRRGVSGNVPEKLNADPGGYVFSGNARDDETGDFLARPAAGDGSAGGAGARGDSAGSSAGAASSARAQNGASGVSGKFPETSGNSANHTSTKESKESAKKSWSTSVRFVDARFEADITPGASVSLSAASFETDLEKRTLEFERLAATVNGRVVVAAARASCASSDVDVDADAETKKRRETFSFDEPIAKRRSVDVTATSPRLALPHGLDLGDAVLAAQVGVDAFRAFLSPRGEDQDEPRDERAADAEKPKPKKKASTQVTLRVVGSLVFDAFDSPAARSLRVKQAVLEPLLARVRARDAEERLKANASTPRRDRAAEAKKMTRLFVLAARAAALKAEGAAFADEERPADFLKRFETEETDEETILSVARGLAVSAAGSVTLGDGSSVAFLFGGDVEKATRFCSRVDAPSEHSQKENSSNEATNLRLMQIKRAFHASCDLNDVAVTLPGAPAPLFAANRLEVTGPVAQARRRRGEDVSEEEKREKTNSLEPDPKTRGVRLAVGRRRFVAAKPPHAPRLPPVRTYTDVDVRLERARACHAVHCEPALASFVRELLRLTPPPGARHAAAPGGGGGRDAAAARVAAAWRAAKRTNDWKGFETFEPSTNLRCVSDDRQETLLCAPLLPLWDVARAVWRGEARVFATDFAATLDADFGYFKKMHVTADPDDLDLSHEGDDSPILGDVSEEPGRVQGDDRSVPRGRANRSEISRLADRGRLEMSASKAAMDLAPGSARVKVARLAFAAAEGGAETTSVFPRETKETLETDLESLERLERLRASEVQLAVIPAFECVAKHAWRSLGAEGDEDHPAARFGVGVDVEVAVTLTTKDAVVKAWREAEKARWMAEDSAAAADDASASASESEKKNVGASSEKSPISRWMSGDFEPATRRHTRGGASDSEARVNAPTPNGAMNAPTNATRQTTASPRSPAFGPKSPEMCVSPTFATVSSAAAASVADASVTPTLIAGPAAISWARRFVKTFAHPPGARRNAWTTPMRGVDATFKKPKHPLKSLLPFAKLFDAVKVTVTADQLRWAHPAERPDDPARGLVFHASGARGAFSLARSERESADSRKETSSSASSSLRVDLEEIRVLLPPSGAAGDEHSCSSREETPTTPGAWRRWVSGTGRDPRTPGSAGASSPSARRFFPGGDFFPGAAGDFDEEAARYEAVAAMLSGSALEPIAGAFLEGSSLNERPLSTDDGERTERNSVNENAFDRERKRRRPRATDPALVLETRSVTLSRGEKICEGEARENATLRVEKKTGANPDLSEMDFGDSFVSDERVFTRVRVESPRLLKAAARRDALVRWARDAWRAATAPETPRHSLSSLEALVQKASLETPGDSFFGKEFPEGLAKESFFEEAQETTGIFPRESDERSREGRETILFVVDVAAPQFNFEGKDGAGRVLVAATAGRVVGRLVESSLQNRKEVTIALQKAQAHVAPTDVDVYAGVQWLDESAFVESETPSTSLETTTETSERRDRDTKTSGYLLRRVFEPCSMDLAFVTKEPPKEASETETEPNDADDTRRKPPPSALTEFALKSPEIEAELTAEQFAALVDVVGSVFLAQLVDEPPPPAIAAARLLANTNRSLVDAEDRASAAVVAAPLARHKRATWRLNAGLADESESRVSATREFPNAIQKRSAVSLALRSALRDAESEVAEAIEKAEALVRPNRRRPAISLRLEIARFRWAMRSGGRSFLVARVEALRLARERHSDTSGTTALKLGDLKLDVPAPASAAIVARTSARNNHKTDEKKKQARVVFTKPVFARWDPDAPEDESFRGAFGFSASRSFGVHRGGERSESRADDASTDLVTVDARRAASPPEAPVWDAIEITVEPFALNLGSETYDTLHRYLFPEKRSANESLRGLKGSRAANHAAFERGLELLASSTRGGRTSKSSGNETELSGFSFPGSSVAERPSERAPSAAEAKARAMLLGAPFVLDKKKGKHARAKTWGADFFGGGGVPVAEPRQFSTPTKPRRGRALTAPEGKHKKAAGARDPVTFRSTLADRAPRPFPLAVDASEIVPSSSAAAPLAAGAAVGASSDRLVAGDFSVAGGGGVVSNDNPNPADLSAPKVVVVKYLKVNDVALKVSYDGPPKSFHEVRLLLDASTHLNFVGRWRELIDKIKKNMVWSVLKSVTGLQGRRLPGGAAAAAEARASASDGAPEERLRERSSRAPFGGKNQSKLGVALVSEGFEGFEGFEGDLDFAEGLTKLGSPTAAAMVAESDGLVVPAGRRGATFSVWRSIFGGGAGDAANKNKDICQNDDAEGRDVRVRDGPDSGDAAEDRAALLSSWGKRR